MKIGDIPSTARPVLIKISPDARVQDAVEILNDNNIGALPVCDEKNKVIGILSERDIVRWLSSHVTGLDGVTVAELMTANVLTCTDDVDLREVMSMMDARGIRHMPVVAKNGELKAMVSSRDILHMLLEDMNAYATKMTLAYEIMR